MTPGAPRQLKLGVTFGPFLTSRPGAAYSSWAKADHPRRCPPGHALGKKADQEPCPNERLATIALGLKRMKITDWQVNERLEMTEVSANVDGFRLWYQVPPSYAVSRAADPFVAAALLPAMRYGQKLEVDPHLSLSPQLLQNLMRLQEIHNFWNPALKIIPISATTSPSAPLNHGAMSFFSAGVDSTYTFLKRISELTHVVFIQGFDFFINVQRSERFLAGDLADLSQLAFKLTVPRDGVSAFLKDSLSKSTLESLSRYQSTGLVPSDLEAGLAEEFDRILAGPPVWTGSRFAGLGLRPETQDLVRKAQPADRYHLNRLLIEDAYPLEIARRDQGTYQTAIDRNTEFIRGFGRTLIPVSTNHFSFGYRYNLSRNLTQGSCLGSIALLLGFPRSYVPASNPYSRLHPLGSHILLDPLYSNDQVTVIHDGAEAIRSAKYVKIAEHETALTNLHVCLDRMDSNCGKCRKCLRTMIATDIYGLKTPRFPRLPSPSDIKRHYQDDLNEIDDNLDLAVRKNRLDLAGALRAIKRRIERKRLFIEADRLFLGGRAGRWQRAISPKPRSFRRISVTPDTSD